MSGGAEPQFWLIKSEPDVFSIADLQRVGVEPWSGVRNYQARNYMWKQMRVGDLCLFYHSNAQPPGIAGLARVASTPYPDETQWQEDSEYFDPRSTRETPRWWLVDVAFERRFDELIPLQRLREMAELEGWALLQKGTRLSIVPVSPQHFSHIMSEAL